MAEEEALTSKVTIDTEGAVKSVEALEQRLSVLEAAFIKSAGGAKKTEDQVKKTGQEAESSGKKGEQAAGFWEKLAKSFESVANHSRTAGIALKQAGLDAEAGAARMSGIAELFKGLGSATPMLLGIGAAVTGMFAAFEGVKGAVDKAAELQKNMAVLGQTVKDQGGNWGKLSQSVNEWAETQERTTTYSKNQTVQALTQLTSTGMSLSDAMKTTRVAEDAAASTGMNLTDINHALMEAMHGRTQALTQLGIGTKAQIKDGMTYNQVLQAIEQHMGGAAAAAADTYQGKMQQLANTFESLQETVGSAVLPVLTQLANGLIHLIQNAEDTFNRWNGALHKWCNEHKNIINLIVGYFKVLGTEFRVVYDVIYGVVDSIIRKIGAIVDFVANVFQGNWKGAWNDIINFFTSDFHAAEDAFGQWGKNILTIAERLAGALGNVFSHIGKAMNDAMHLQWGNIANDMKGALSGFGGLTAGLKWNNDAWGGMFNRGGGKHGEGNPADTNTSQTERVGGGHGGGHHKKGPSADSLHRKEIAAENKRLNEEIKHIELLAKQHKITTEQEIKDLEQILNKEKMTAAERQKITQEIIALKHQESKAEAEAAKKKQEAYKKSFEHLVKTLEEEVKAHKISHAQMAADLQDWVNKHKDADNQILQHARDTIQQQQDLQVKTDTENQKKLEEWQKKWEAYYAKLEENATKWADKADGFIEGFFQKGKKGMSGFSDEWKKMLKDMEHAMLKSFLIKMFMGGQGPGFGSLFAKGMGFGGPTAQAPSANPFQNAANAGSTGAASGGILGALVGTGNASSVAGALPTDSVMSMLLGVGFGGAGGAGGGAAGLAAIFGGAGGADGAAGAAGAFYGGGATGAASGVSSLSGLGSLANIGKFLGMHLPGGGAYVGMGTVGSTMLGAAGGYLVGSGIHGLLFGNQPLNQGSQLGGALGGAAGAAFGPALDALLGIGTGGIGLIAGPLLGALGGSIIGGLFGNHDNPANMPDKYDTQRFGTIVADLQGQMGANGQHFSEQSQLSSASGGLTGIQWVEETLAKYAKAGTTQMGSDTPDWLKPMWNQLVSMFGISATGSGKLNFGHAINNENVTGAQGVDGQTYQYTDLGKALDQFYQNYITQGQLQTTNPNNPNNPNGNNPGFFASSPFSGVYTIGADGKPVASDTGLPALNVLPGDTSGGGGASGGGGGSSVGAATGDVMRRAEPTEHTIRVTVEGGVIGGDDLAAKLEAILGDRIERNIFSRYNGGPNA